MSANRPHAATSEAEIRAVQESWRTAVNSQNLAAIAAHYSPRVVAFDAVAQLQFKGVDAYMKHWTACMDMCPQAMHFEFGEMAVTAFGDNAFAHCLLRCGFKDQDGDMQGSWTRATFCYGKENGRWTIVHEHFSAPFDMESRMAIFDAKP